MMKYEQQNGQSEKNSILGEGKIFSRRNSYDKNLAVLQSDTAGIRFFSPDAPEFRLEGFAWRTQGMPYDRLAGGPEALPFRDKLVRLAKYPAGACLRFYADTDRIVIRAGFSHVHRIVRMALTGIMGFDVYVRNQGKLVFAGVTAFDFDVMEYCVDLFKCDERQMREFVIYFPLLAELTTVEIGVCEDTCFAGPPAWEDSRPLVAYGTSILHGACANHPGMAYPAILGRLLERPVLNFGFAGNAWGEDYMAQMLAHVANPCGFLLDYDPNSSITNTMATLPRFLQILREKHPKVPIIVVSQIPYPPVLLFPSHAVGLAKRTAMEQALINEWAECNVHFVPGTILVGENYDEISADGVHLSDYGFVRMAGNLASIIQKLL